MVTGIKIKNFKAIKVASIIGNGCEDEFDGIFIYKFKEDNKNLKEKLPIGRIQKYKSYKWEFIKQYWTKNYLKFK